MILGWSVLGETPFRAVANGVPGLETRLSILFSEGVMKGRIDLCRFVALTATNNAKLSGLYQRKGTIALGSVADLAIWDPDARRKIANADLHHNVDYTPFEGLEVRGWPVTVVCRGVIVFDGGEVLARKGRGTFPPQPT